MKVINFVLKKMKKQIIEETVSLNTVIKAVIMYIIVWSAMGLQFALLIFAFYRGGMDVVSLFSIYPASWTLAFVVLVVPAGIGLREGTIYFFLSQLMPKDFAIYGALLSRIEITIGELMYLLLLFGSGKLWRKNENKK